jgi:phosphoglycerate dehydrogenase-like enzyme
METRSPEHLVIDHLSSFGKEEIAQYPGLRAIATASTGTDHIDLQACEEAGIKVYSLLDDREALAEIRASSEFTFMAILMGLRRIDRVIVGFDRGEAGHELYGKTVGVIGAGRIGENVMQWCSAFGATVQWHDPYRAGYSSSLEEIFAECNVVCITCSLTEETAHMIDYSLMASMVENAVLVNTSRGAVINERDLRDVLQKRQDITAVLDVMEGELDGSRNESPLWFMKNVIITPHIAGYTVESNAKAHKIAEGLLDHAV